jgi:GNAT superfamily N-acetyltransferase
MIIRAAAKEDAIAISQLVLELGYEITSEDVSYNISLYGQAKGIVLVAVENNTAIGFITGIFIPLFHAKERMFRITALCVAEAQRGKGIGKMLLHQMESRCLENDCRYLEVTSGPHRAADAHLFYQRLGYEIYEGRRFKKRLNAIMH